ncbi:unnamed protein product [Rotaria sp. Silwood1]|nr:unnamed protein product [Rotaria sp. Silwood1]CAF4861947.1 unnamed protein product [Rotaria sp. Silwood1]
MQWLDAATVSQKLGAVYYYLNNGEPIGSDMIGKLLKHVYPEVKEDELRALSQQFMQQLGVNERSKLNMQQFVDAVQRSIPSNELEEILKFDIIPTHLLDEASALPSLPGSSTNIHNINVYGNYDVVNDEQLRQIASQVSYKNWSKLALALGFLEYDIEAYKIKNNNDSSATMLELLHMWREQEGSLATKNRLKRYLEDSGFQELIPLLN